MANIFDYIFNVGGNYTATLNGMTEATGKFEANVHQTSEAIERLGQKAFAWTSILDFTKNLGQNIQEFSRAGIDLDTQMHDLSAVAGVTGDALKQIEGYARESAKAFGTDASTAVTGYKLLLSQLSPELGKYPEALKAMGNSIQITSKLMGGDGVAAAEVLTTAMNQYGVSLADPMKASEEMARMMNVMAAAGQAGSAELPAIKVALEQCGMAAKGAGVSFEETNAAIQVLDKAGKKGSEGGVALRNVMSTLAQGRFLPKDVQEELKTAGINVLELGDKSKTLKERLEILKPVMQDSALFSKLFGRENANAAMALVGGTAALGEFTDAVTGTSSAEEQAAIVMDSYAERQARINQQIQDFKISIFQATGDTALWAGAIMEMLIPVSQLMPLIMGLGNLMTWIKNLNWAGMWQRITMWGRNAALSIALLNSQETINNGISLGFIGNIGRVVVQLVRVATVGVAQALKGLGAYIASLITSGTTSATFSAIASTSFSAFAVTASAACKAVGIAIMNIPIIGWIAALIAAIIALGTYLWNHSAKFRGILKGLWESCKAFFNGVKDAASKVFGAVKDLIKGAFTLDFKLMGNALSRLTGAFADLGRSVGDAFWKAYFGEIWDGKTVTAKDGTVYVHKGGKWVRQEEGEGGGGKSFLGSLREKMQSLKDKAGEYKSVSPTGNTLSGTGGKAGKAGTEAAGGHIKNVTVSVGKLVEKLEIHTATLKESTEDMREAVVRTLLSALNDVNIATG